MRPPRRWRSRCSTRDTRSIPTRRARPRTRRPTPVRDRLPGRLCEAPARRIRPRLDRGRRVHRARRGRDRGRRAVPAGAGMNAPGGRAPGRGRPVPIAELLDGRSTALVRLGRREPATGGSRPRPPMLRQRPGERRNRGSGGSGSARTSTRGRLDAEAARMDRGDGLRRALLSCQAMLGIGPGGSSRRSRTRARSARPSRGARTSTPGRCSPRRRRRRDRRFLHAARPPADRPAEQRRLLRQHRDRGGARPPRAGAERPGAGGDRAAGSRRSAR